MPVAAPSVSCEEPEARAVRFRPALPPIAHLSMRLALLLLIALAVVLQYRLWVGEGSLAEVHGLQQEIADQKAELERLRARNQQLRAEVTDLQSGEAALEERARGELGMIKPGEAFIQAIERHKATPAPAPSAK